MLASGMLWQEIKYKNEDIHSVLQINLKYPHMTGQHEAHATYKQYCDRNKEKIHRPGITL